MRFKPSKGHWSFCCRLERNEYVIPETSSVESENISMIMTSNLTPKHDLNPKKIFDPKVGSDRK